MRKLSLIFVVLILLCVDIPAQSSRWNWIGPEGGDIQQIIPDRREPKNWFVINSGRLYRSTDATGQWTRTPLKDVIQVQVHSQTSEVFVLVRHESQNFELWASRNGGKTFGMRAVLVSYDYTPKLLVHPIDPGSLFVLGPGTSGLQFSHDGGRNWQDLPPIPYKSDPEYPGCNVIGNTFYDFLVAPFDPNTLYATALIEISCHPRDENFEYQSWVSGNAGKVWKKLDRDLVNFQQDTAFPDEAYGIELTDQYEWMLDRLTRDGLQPVGKLPGSGLEITRVPGNRDKLFSLLGYFSVLKSLDGGKNWKETRIKPNWQLSVLQVMDDPQGSLLGGTVGGGLFRRNANQGWTPANSGFRETFVTRLLTAVDLSDIYAVAGEYGQFLFRSRDLGKTWQDLSFDLPPGNILDAVLNPNDPKHIAIATSSRGIFSSEDSGSTWKRGNGIPGSTTNVAYDPMSRGRMYAIGFSTIYQSSDNGSTFTKLATMPSSVRRMVIDPNDSRILYLVTTAGGIFKSIDGGMTVTAMNSGFDPACRNCDVYYLFDITPLAARDAYLALEQTGTLYRTLNGGKQWEKIGRVPFSTRIYVGDDSGNHLFAAGVRLYESLDAGKTWNKSSGGLEGGTSVLDISNPRFSPLLIATSHGVYMETNP